jgi:hypothetical protein
MIPYVATTFATNINDLLGAPLSATADIQ